MVDNQYNVQVVHRGRPSTSSASPRSTSCPFKRRRFAFNIPLHVKLPVFCAVDALIPCATILRPRQHSTLHKALPTFPSSPGPANVLNLCILDALHLNGQNTPNLLAVLEDRYSIPYLFFLLLRGDCVLHIRGLSLEYCFLFQP
jgi:hypothetical protein